MRILFLASDAYGGNGGIAKFNRDFLKALCFHPEVTKVVAVPRRMAYPPETLPPKLTFVTSGLNNKFLYVYNLVRIWREYRKFDLICCAHINLLSVAYLLKLLCSSTLVLMLHGIDAWSPTKSRLNNYLTSKVDALVAVSAITRQRFLTWTHVRKAKVFLLPNAVEPEKFGPGAKSPDLLKRYGLSSKIILMTLGRLAASERYKGFDEIIELLPALANQIPNIAYLIVGDGDDRPRLTEKAQALGVGDRVVFAGFIPEAEKAKYYRLADAFVMPSRGEGFGIVFLEALACGIPVVGSRLDGSREALREGALGVLVDPRCPDDIQAGILEALKRPRGVIPDGLDYFSFENFEKRCHGILEDVLKSKQAG